MDLRVKCKCGKTLQIPESLAGKKVSCPGCKKIYRIPAEKFGLVSIRAAAAQPVAVAARASGSTAAEIDALLSPSEIDISPSQLDLLGDLGASSNDLISNAPLKTGAMKSCPSCQKIMAESSVLCTACGFNTATGKLTKTKAKSKPTKARVAAGQSGGAGIAKLGLLIALLGGIGFVGWYFFLRH